MAIFALKICLQAWRQAEPTAVETPIVRIPGAPA
jgi:hypothetical protein